MLERKCAVGLEYGLLYGFNCILDYSVLGGVVWWRLGEFGDQEAYVSEKVDFGIELHHCN